MSLLNTNCKSVTSGSIAPSPDRRIFVPLWFKDAGDGIIATFFFSAFFLFLLCLFLLFCCFQWFFLLGFLCILGLCHTGFLLEFFIYRYCALFPSHRQTCAFAKHSFASVRLYEGDHSSKKANLRICPTIFFRVRSSSKFC